MLNLNSLYYSVNPNIFTLFTPNIFTLFVWAIPTILVFMVYKKFLPKPSTVKSIMFSILIAFVILIVLQFHPYLIPESVFPRSYYLINSLLSSIIIGLILIPINYIVIKNDKISVKIGILSIPMMFLATILLAAPAI